MIPDRIQKIDSKKFESIFKSLDSQMKKQTIVLESILSIEQDRKLDEERKNQLEEMKYEEEKMRRKADEDRERLPEPDNIPPRQEQSSGIGPALAGLLGFELGKADISSVWDLAIKAGFIGIIAKPLSDFMGGMIAMSLEKLGLDESVSAGAADIIADTGVALLAGKILGSVLGKRFGMALAIGGLIYTKLDDMFDKNQDGFIDAFGGQFSTAWVSGLGAVIGGVVMLYLPTILRGGLAALFKRVVPTALAAIAAGVTTAAPVVSSAATTLTTTAGAGGGAVLASPLAPLAVGAGPVALTLGVGSSAVAKVNRFEPYLNKAQETASRGNFEKAADIMKRSEVELKEPLPISLEGTRYPEYWAQPNIQYEVKKKIAVEKLSKGIPNHYNSKDESFTPLKSPNIPMSPISPTPSKKEIEDFLKNSATEDKSRYNILTNEINNYLKTAEAPSSKGKGASATINDNKVSSVKGDSIINNITHITTPPSYSLNHFIPS